MDQEQILFFKSVDDPRAYAEEGWASTYLWRTKLRERLYATAGRRSVLTQKPITAAGFDLHEGLYPRNYVRSSSWQQYLFTGPNCFVLRPEEHRADPPDRILCYWLAVARYDKQSVDRWIDSLPFKTKDTPWAGTRGLEIIDSIPHKWEIDPHWYDWYLRSESKIDYIG